jgi:hypothetical protein
MPNASADGQKCRILLLALLFSLIIVRSSRGIIGLVFVNAPLPADFAIYTRIVLAFDYFQFGFVRRGLGGTFASLFGDVAEPMTGLLFHISSAAFLATPIIFLVSKLTLNARRSEAIAYSLFLLVSPYLLIAWNVDLLRTDMLVCGFIAWAAVAMAYARPYIAVIVLSVGSLVHETALIFGVPLVAALCFVAYQNGRVTRSAVTRSCALLLLLLAFIGVMLHFSVSPDQLSTFASVVKTRFPAHPLIEHALYAYLAEWRGIRSSVCSNLLVNPRYWIYLPAIVLIIAIHLAAFGAQTRLSVLLFCAAAIVPAIALSVIATDLARWQSFGIFNVWLMAVTVTLIKPDLLRPLHCGLWKRIAIIVAISLLGNHPPWSPSSTIEEVADALGIARASYIYQLDVCDPGWRDFVSFKLNQGMRGSASHP